MYPILARDSGYVIDFTVGQSFGEPQEAEPVTATFRTMDPLKPVKTGVFRGTALGLRCKLSLRPIARPPL